jgi:V8-like Glu-specific endopeptidase
LLSNAKLEEALDILEANISPISVQLGNAILLNKESLSSLNMKLMMGTITDSNANVQRTNIALNMLNILSQVPLQIETQQMIGKCIYKTTTEANFERILGPVNSLVKINWLHKGIKASKSVCQVVRPDGGKGTGFVLEDGYLMTNWHVIYSKELAASSKIIFNYEEDLSGNLQKTSEYSLESDNCKFSRDTEFDYAYIKIKDNPIDPLSQWGSLDIDTFSDPQTGQPVTIIQHPLGNTKYIALTLNQIISVDKPKLFYRTDTEKGSSGSPVFNNEWKVIALHHAGMKEEDGGLVINKTTGERRGANEGILIKPIIEHIGIFHS